MLPCRGEFDMERSKVRTVVQALDSAVERDVRGRPPPMAAKPVLDWLHAELPMHTEVPV
jgi:hypothetical protein